MSARRLLWRTAYELLTRRVRRPEWAFMNYGYAPAGGGDLALEAADEVDRLCIQLYEHTVAGDVAGRDVLEVGSGRGGGSSYLSRYRGTRTMTGVDFSAGAVALCTRHRRGPGLRFVQGDAQALPFPDATFDAVVNVESSHCYGSVPAFLTEVRRVLRPGGDLYWADLRPTRDLDALRAQFRDSGLVLREERDITAEVLRAMRTDSDRKLGLIRAWFPRSLHPALRPFAGIEGTQNYTGLEQGRQRYLSAWLVKEG
ncbi:class I SAM-dependent methyltransferase [Kineococcus sp. NUM-3379]